MMRKARKEEFESIYALMEQSFPLDEYRTCEEQKKLLEHPAYNIYVLPGAKSTDIRAFLAVWEFEELVFVEHFAVAPTERNQGTGSHMLRQLLDMRKKPACLEVEPPVEDFAARRIGFYERVGFCLNEYPYVMPALSGEKRPVQLMVMTYPEKVCEAEFIKIKQLLMREVYGRAELEKKTRRFVRAKQTDREQILSLYRSLVGTEFCAWTKDYPSEAEVDGDLSRGDLFCLKDGREKIIGVISIDKDESVDNLSCWTDACSPALELSRLGVREEFQNQGVAAELILSAMEEVKRRGKRGIHFLVCKTNEKAIRSYAKLGFDVAGECEMYGEAWWCYEKSLKE